MGSIFMLLAALGFSLSVILMRVMTQSMSMPIYQIGIWRFLIAGSLIWFVDIFRTENAQLPKNRLVSLIGLGLIFSISGFSALSALDKIPSSIYIIIIYIYPSLVVLFALLRHRPVPGLVWIGLPMSFIGLVLTAYHPGQSISVNPIGLTMTLINACARAIYFILGESIFDGVKNRFSGTIWVITGTTLVSLVLIPFLGLTLPSTSREWIMLLTYSILGTLMPILSMNIGLQLLGAARSSVMITIQPVITILMSVLFLNEILSFRQWMGGLLVIFANLVLQISPKRNS
jgi:drug/metabolite transporter (DMT)-like permease